MKSLPLDPLSSLLLCHYNNNKLDLHADCLDENKFYDSSMMGKEKRHA